jgi:hypothetical protein
MPPDRLALLPDEIVLDITQCLHSITRNLGDNVPINRNILSLARCSKRLRRIALPVIYSTVKITNIKYLNGFLSSLIEIPTYAFLVEDLSLELHLFVNFGQIRPLYTTELVKLLRDPQCTLPEDLALGIKSHEPWANALVLLLLLQNLKMLHIEAQPGFQDNVDLWLTSIINKVLVPNRLQKFSWGGSNSLEMGILLPLFLFPSIVEICIDLVYSIFPLKHPLSLPSGFQLAAHIRTSNVERLMIRNANIMSQDFSTFIRLPRVLRALVYKGQENRHEESPVLDHFKQALDCVSNTLEYLDIEWKGRTLADDNSTMWSFHNFTALKVLCINYDLIYNFDVTTINRTVQSLPPTLEVLVMYNQHSPGLQTTGYAKFEFWISLLGMKTSTCLSRLRLIAQLRSLTFLSSVDGVARSSGVEIASSRARLQLEGIVE